MNVTGEDFFEKLWVAAAFAPLAVIYTNLLLALNILLDQLNTVEIFKEINDLLLGWGIATLVSRIVQTAAKKSHNDFIAGPIEQLNLYMVFFYALITRNIRLAIILIAAYLVVEAIGIFKNEWRKYRHLGRSRKSIILYQLVIAPFATIISALVAYWILEYFFPVTQWISSGIIFQIKYMTFQVVLWTAIYKILVVWIEGIRVKGFSPIHLIAILMPLMFYPGQAWEIFRFFYAIAILYAWHRIGLHIWLGIEEAKKNPSPFVRINRN